MSSSSTASDSSTDKESHNDRFEIISENEKFKWKLPKCIANCSNKYFEEYIPEDSLKEAILFPSPVPDNLDNVKKLDDFLRDILEEKRKINEKNIESVLEKLQRKTVDVMGPLSKLWNILEGAKGESRRGRIGETGGKRNVEEGSYQRSSTIKRGTCKQLIPRKKEG